MMNEPAFRRTIRSFIEAEGLLLPGQRVVVALSGGADSVALLRVLLSLGYSLEAAHCNFHLRAEESDRDEAFVRSLCASLSVPLQVRHFDTSAYAGAHGLSVEMAARELRYAWFEQVRREARAEAVAVAHHRDDSVETLLLNLVRGTGLRGLTGIAPRHGRIIRPLLGVRRADILDYLTALGQDYVTDSTNLEDLYRRNKIRLRVLPLLQELNPSIVESLAATAARLGEAEKVYRQGIEEGMRRVLRTENEASEDASLFSKGPSSLDRSSLDRTQDLASLHRTLSIPRLMAEPSPRALLHELLAPYGFHPAQEADIFASIAGESGRRFRSSEWELLRDRDAFLLRKIPAPAEEDAPTPELQITTLERTPDFRIPRDKQVACLDADLLRQPLTVRRPRKGDRFVPFGMRGSKLLSDYFTDRKFTAFQKEAQWVVCCGEDIVWLVDERPDARYCVSDKTVRLMLLEIK